MLKCWQHYPEERPQFPNLQEELDIMLTSQQKEEYIEINNVDEPYCQMYPAQEDDPVDNSNIPVSKTSALNWHKCYGVSWAGRVNRAGLD